MENKSSSDKEFKWSKYNCVVQLENSKYVLYNTLTNNIVTILESNIDILNKSLFDVKTRNITFFNILKEKEFIVSKDYNEKEKAVLKLKSETKESHFFELIINPTLNCNLKCWYCYEKHLKNTHISKETLNSIFIFIKNIVEQKDLEKLLITFFGGEPLLEFNSSILEIIQYAKKVCNKYNKKLMLSFVTNGTLLNSDIINLLYMNEYDCTFQVTFDGNRKFHDATKKMARVNSTFDIIIENIMYALSKGFKFIIRYNYTKDNFETFKDVTDIFTTYAEQSIKYKQIRFSYHRVWQDHDVKHMHLPDNGVPHKNIQNSSFDICYADRENSVIINYDGKIYKCTARDFREDNSEGLLNKEGSIIYNSNMKKRMDIRYNNDNCVDCLIFPICNICSQYCLENINRNSGCLRNLSDNDKLHIILDRINVI